MKKSLILGPILVDLAQIWFPQIFLRVLPVLVVKHSKLSCYAIYRKINEPNLRKRQKA